jgi:hypothetical protein
MIVERVIKLRIVGPECLINPAEFKNQVERAIQEKETQVLESLNWNLL